jgi:RNA polymerase subunit RPABC4/transcription elongation factor Spt4
MGTPFGGCPFCGGKVTFDWGLDLNVCFKCGAKETAKGWMNPPDNEPEEE